MAKKYVPEGAFTACNKGTSPSTLRVSNNKSTTIYSVPMATELDFLPFFNLKPMGFCSSPMKWMSGITCLPTVTGWQQPKDGVKINGSRMLLEDSYCDCIFGGKINIFFDRAAAVSFGLGEGKMPSEYIKEGFDWLEQKNKESRAARDSFLPDWMKPVTGVTDWMDDLGMGLAEGAVNGVVGLGETLYQVGQDPVGTAEALGGMIKDGATAAWEGAGNAYDWASKGENWSNAAEGAWNWASDGQNWVDAGNATVQGVQGAGSWVAQNPRKIGTTVGEFIPDAVAAAYTAGGSLAVTGAKVAGKEVLEEAGERVVREALEEGAEKAGKEALEAGAKRSTTEVLEQLAKHEGGDIAKVVTKSADEIAEEAAKEAAERWAKLGYDDLGKTAPCFLAGTFVHTVDGLVPIENIKIGDIVFCYDKFNKSKIKNKVVNVYNNWTDRFITITTDKETINTTFKHLFWVENEEKWITAKELKKNMFLKSLSLNSILIKSIDYQNNVNLFTYNIEVENSHNYFVGNQGLLVHNDNKPSKFESTTKKPIKIYEVYDTRTGEVKYVGQTDKPSVQDRFNEHLNSKDTKKIDRTEWNKHYDIREVHSGNWDPYEASVWEQHYMEKNGGKPNLENGRNEITKAKYDKYKNLHNPC